MFGESSETRDRDKWKESRKKNTGRAKCVHGNMGRTVCVLWRWEEGEGGVHHVDPLG